VGENIDVIILGIDKENRKLQLVINNWKKILGTACRIHLL
jgi:ribosomal protein S1